MIVAAVLGFVVATSFWLAYFDFFPIRARQLLTDRSGAERTALARDVYTYLHLPMVAGIVLFAFAMKTTLAHVGDELARRAGVRPLRRPRPLPVRVRRRSGARVGHARPRPLDRRGLRARLLWPVAIVVPALVALTIVAIVWVALHAYEIIWWRDARAATRRPSPLRRRSSS